MLDSAELTLSRFAAKEENRSKDVPLFAFCMKAEEFMSVPSLPQCFNPVFWWQPWWVFVLYQRFTQIVEPPRLLISYQE